MTMQINRWVIALAFVSVLVSIDAFASIKDDCIAQAAGWQKGELIKPYSDVEPDKATEVCASAVREYPDDFQMKSLYCRALLSKDMPLLALEYCFSAAERGETEAMNLLGYICSSEYQDVLDNNTSFEWYEQSANAGNAIGQYNVGRYLLYGIHSKKDIKAAQYWLSASAKQGLPEAMLLLAITSDESVGGKKMREQVDAAFNRFSSTYGVSQVVTLDNIKIYVEWLAKNYRYDQAVIFIESWLRRVTSSDEKAISAKIYLLRLGGSYRELAGKKDLALNAFQDALAIFDDGYISTHSRDWLDLAGKILSLQREIGTGEQLLETALDILDSLHESSAGVGALKESICRDTKSLVAAENDDWLQHCGVYMARL
jgi:tetratricopeptide (TPR) repeat protein